MSCRILVIEDDAAVRDTLRAAKQWQLADIIRDGLAERGIAIADGPTGSTWRQN